MKKILLTILAGLAITAVQADLLYWQVPTTVTVDDNSETWRYARLVYNTSSDTAPTQDGIILRNYVGQDTSVTLNYITSAQAGRTDIAAILDPEINMTGYYFAIELINAAGDTIVANTGWQAYNEVRQYIVDSTFSESYKTMTAGFGSNISNWSAGPVPEPTSGMLLLVGAALLGLRRKRA